MGPVIGELRELLAKGISLAGEVTDSRSWDAPVAGSPAAAEIAAEEGHPGRPTGSWPWLSGPKVARWALQVATTEAEGFAAVLDVGTPYAADVLCRAVLESISLAWWLLEPDIGAPRRLARALAYRLRSAVETERAVEHLGLADDEDRSGYGERRAEVIGAIEELGLEHRAARGGRSITVDGETLPGYSARVSALVRAAWPQPGLPYTLLSQVGHGELGGLARGSLGPGTAEPGRALSPSDRFWIWHDSYLVLGSLALAAHRAAVFLGARRQATRAPRSTRRAPTRARRARSGRTCDQASDTNTRSIRAATLSSVADRTPLEIWRRSIAMLPPGAPSGLTREEAIELIAELQRARAELGALRDERDAVRRRPAERDTTPGA